LVAAGLGENSPKPQAPRAAQILAYERQRYSR
jgi:hypothetical protein